ncbi:GntR family transcriptional regulator [Oceaniglobus trochenteri]|uniref:GntR family transcriptional regulator n=1 Tax=Oceaniglobus trochenteri TaxID=2763260 RepID=UPI001CFF933E|nr:GntR family transcriptional regulator [Oceaniglobus trochenteri]
MTTAPVEEDTTPLARLLLGLGRADGTTGPRYAHLGSAMRGLIELGEWRGGMALPPERVITEATGLSRATVRRAIDTLVAEGLITRQQGAGNFVSRAIDQPLSVLVGFTEDMRLRGAATRSVVLRQGVEEASPSHILKLGLSPGEKVFRLDRVRLANEEPLAIERAVVPAASLGRETVDVSLYAAMRAAGVMPARALQRIHAAISNDEESRLLGQGETIPILRVERRSFLANGRPIEVTTSSYRGDRYDFVAELTLGAGG